MKTTFLLLFALPLLGACVVEDPYYGRPQQPYRGGYYPAPASRVVIHQDYDNDRDGDWRDRDHDWHDRDDRRDDRPYHCPPGQAKKGNC